MALFIVLIVVVVLSVVIAQLSITTKVEEQIVESQKGYLEISYSFQSVCRTVMSTLYQDWVDDQSEAETGEDPTGAGGLGGGAGGQTPGASQGLPGTGTSGAGAGAGTTTDPDGVAHFDGRHDPWREELRENLNEVEVTIRIRDGESAIDLNELFWYVWIEDDPDNRGQSSGADVIEDATEGAGEPDPLRADGTETESELEDEEEEFVPPTEERIERTIEMLARIIESMIEYNNEANFVYEYEPDPDSAAQAIVEWVETRLQDPELRPIRSLDGIRNLEAISWELYNGPVDPEAEEREEEESLYESYDEYYDEYADESLYPGHELLDDETGVVEIPRPMGLRHVLTAYSDNGKINMNTVHWVVLSGLLLDIPDYEQSIEVARTIHEHANDFVEEDPDAETVLREEEEEEAERAFNEYRVFDDLLIDEEWNNREAGEEASVWDVMRKSLLDTGTAVYHSTTFIAHLNGKKGDRELEGELVVLRNGTSLKVVYWRDLSDR